MYDQGAGRADRRLRAGPLTMTRLRHVLAAITWSPGFRGILVVAVGVLVLMGSVYLLLATNTGARLGFLLALTGLIGWMTIMGLVWSMYGIGKQGPAASWKVEELNYDDLTQAEVGGRARRSRSRTQLPDRRVVPRGRPRRWPKQFPATEGVKRPSSATCSASIPTSRSRLRGRPARRAGSCSPRPTRRPVRRRPPPPPT